MTPGTPGRPGTPGGSSDDRVRPIDPDLVRRIAELVDGVELDLDAPLAQEPAT